MNGTRLRSRDWTRCWRFWRERLRSGKRFDQKNLGLKIDLGKNAIGANYVPICEDSYTESTISLSRFRADLDL